MSQRRTFAIGTAQDFSYLLPRRLGAGRYVLDVFAVDGAGNRGQLTRGQSRVTEAADGAALWLPPGEELVALLADRQELVVPGERLLDELHRRLQRCPGRDQDHGQIGIQRADGAAAPRLLGAGRLDHQILHRELRSDELELGRGVGAPAGLQDHDDLGRSALRGALVQVLIELGMISRTGGVRRPAR